MKTKQSFSGLGCFSPDAGNLPRGGAASLGFEELVPHKHLQFFAFKVKLENWNRFGFSCALAC